MNLRPLHLVHSYRVASGVGTTRFVSLLCVTFLALATACIDLRFNAGGGGGDQPPSDCISPQRPENGTLCGLNAWDRDGDTISFNTEINSANDIANGPTGGFYDFDPIKWNVNESQARGVATNGTLYKGMNLTNAGDGYEHYDACDGVDVDDWGTGHLVRFVEGAGRWWTQLRSVNVRMQVGDLSLKLGGEFAGHPGVPGCETSHVYHRQGIDVDIRYVRADGQANPLNICEAPDDWDAPQTAVLINSFLAAEHPDDANARIDSIFVELDCWTLPTETTNHRRLVWDAAGHDNHFHVRIVDPDGPFN